MFENRTYRKLHQKKGLVSFDITVKETNLNIQAEKDLSKEAVKAVLDVRNIIEAYIGLHPDFASSFVPLSESGPVPDTIQQMLKASRLAKVGPMAAVAGTIAQAAGEKLLEQSGQILVENGGDIFVKSNTHTLFSIYAGESSPFSMSCGIRVEKREKPYGLCTSSGTLGHSKSFGKADAAIVLSDSCALADAAATALGNRIQTAADIGPAIDKGKSIPGILGVVIIQGSSIGAWGKLSLVDISA